MTEKIKYIGLDVHKNTITMAIADGGCRNKNDVRDAVDLARLHRAGELTAVYVPHLEDEAMRDLTRAREDAKTAAKKAKQQLSAFLLRNGHTFTGRSNWLKAHFNTFTPYQCSWGKAGGLQIRRCQGLAVDLLRLHPWRLGSEALRLLQHWGKM